MKHFSQNNGYNAIPIVKTEKHIPTGILQPFVKRFMIVESDDGMQNRILPDSSLVMAFRYRGRIAHATNGQTGYLPLAVISGLRKSPRSIEYTRNSAILLVAFNEGGASAFIRTPLHELFGEMVSLENFFPPQVLTGLADQLSEAGNNAGRFSIMEEFLINRLIITKRDELVNHAIQKINLTNGTYRIKSLVEDLCISTDAFEKRFRKSVGTTPKHFSNIIRMKHLIQSGYQSNDLASLVFSANYFDQAHFTKDFKLFTGETPQVFFRTPPRW